MSGNVSDCIFYCLIDLINSFKEKNSIAICILQKMQEQYIHRLSKTSLFWISAESSNVTSFIWGSSVYILIGNIFNPSYCKFILNNHTKVVLRNEFWKSSMEIGCLFINAISKNQWFKNLCKVNLIWFILALLKPF